jgi:hypothetical protein
MKKCLTCKKELIGTRIYRVNEKYEIYQVGSVLNDNNLFILTEEYNDKFSTNIIGQWFGISFEHKIPDYFYTDKEIRKLKLEKLSNV